MANSPQLAEGAGPEPDPLAASVSRTGLLSRSGHLEYDRILFFSDAVFAIAITLLIVDLPPGGPPDPDPADPRSAA